MTRTEEPSERELILGPNERGYSAVSEFSSFDRNNNNEHFESVRSVKRHKWNVALTVLLVTVSSAFVGLGVAEYRRIVAIPKAKSRMVDKAIKDHAALAAVRAKQCVGYDWASACDKLAGAGAGARRRNRNLLQQQKRNSSSNAHRLPGMVEQEDTLLFDDDDFTVTFDSNCLRVYRLTMFGGSITFPYHANQMLLAGGNFTMALFIQHGALRNAEDYFCSFKKLMLQQNYRSFDEILIIAPDFNYEHDALVHPNDAFWNSTKPWGDWRVGAQSDPDCCGKSGRTVSSFEVLDHMLTLLTDTKLYPKMKKISYVGHSAGTLFRDHIIVTRFVCCFISINRRY